MDKDRIKKQDDILAQELRKRSEDYQLPVSDAVWDRIENDLLPVVSTAKRLKVWSSISAVAAAAIIAIWLGWNGYYSGLWAPDIQPVAQITATSAPILTTNDEQLTSVEPEQVPVAKVYTKIPIVAVVASSESVEKPAIQEKPAMQEKTEVQEKPDMQEKPVEKVEPVPDYANLLGLAEELWADEDISVKKKKKENLSIALAYTNSGSSSSSSLPAQDWYAATFPCVMTLDKRELPKNTAVSNRHYKMPISFGLFVRKSLSSDWALESGLVYTYLESTETRTLPNGNSSSEDTKLHYIGVPLNVVYPLYNNRRLSVYASAGGMVEKDISATVSELQWSLAGSVGLNYRLMNHLNLFAEPKVGYYFDNESPVKTIRQDQPWNFGLQIGLRYDL